jgi:hypothetical protein
MLVGLKVKYLKATGRESAGTNEAGKAFLILRVLLPADVLPGHNVKILQKNLVLRRSSYRYSDQKTHRLRRSRLMDSLSRKKVMMMMLD